MKRILIVGGGSIGERHLRCFQRTGRAEVSLCEIREELRQRLTEQYRLSETYASLDESLAGSFDAGVICTPAHLHISMARQFAERSIPLVIEKPLSTSVEGIADLMEEIESRDLKASVAYVLRQHPGLALMKQMLDESQFGRPVQIVMTSGQHFPFYRPAYRETYYTKHETGGGAIQDALTHMMNAAEWLVGPVTKLVADAEHCLLEGVEVEDTAHILTRHGPVLGSFSLNQHQPANETSLTVICEGGQLRFEGHNSRLVSCREPDQPWTVEAEFSIERDDLFIAQANGFLDQLEDKRGPACSITEALQTLKVNLAALESVKSGKWIIL